MNLQKDDGVGNILSQTKNEEAPLLMSDGGSARQPAMGTPPEMMTLPGLMAVQWTTALGEEPE